jgi:hypothetical protein
LYFTASINWAKTFLRSRGLLKKGK